MLIVTEDVFLQVGLIVIFALETLLRVLYVDNRRLRILEVVSGHIVEDVWCIGPYDTTPLASCVLKYVIVDYSVATDQEQSSGLLVILCWDKDTHALAVIENVVFELGSSEGNRHLVI